MGHRRAQPPRRGRLRAAGAREAVAAPPDRRPPYFAAQIGCTIALFGGVHAWLATQPRIERALVVVGALGKLAFWGLTVAYSVAGAVPASMALNATPDLLFASIFLWWAHTEPVSR